MTSSNLLTRAQVIRILREANIEFEAEATLTQLRPLYDDWVSRMQAQQRQQNNTGAVRRTTTRRTSESVHRQNDDPPAYNEAAGTGPHRSLATKNSIWYTASWKVFRINRKMQRYCTQHVQCVTWNQHWNGTRRKGSSEWQSKHEVEMEEQQQSVACKQQVNRSHHWIWVRLNVITVNFSVISRACVANQDSQRPATCVNKLDIISKIVHWKARCNNNKWHRRLWDQHRVQQHPIRESDKWGVAHTLDHIQRGDIHTMG